VKPSWPTKRRSSTCAALRTPARGCRWPWSVLGGFVADLARLTRGSWPMVRRSFLPGQPLSPAIPEVRRGPSRFLQVTSDRSRGSQTPSSGAALVARGSVPEPQPLTRRRLLPWPAATMPLHRLRLQSITAPGPGLPDPLCLITLRSTLDPILQRRAVRRGAASCRAALRSCPITRGGRCRGVVTAEPSWVAERRRGGNPSEVRAAQPAVAVVVAVQDVRTPATPFVALSASAVRHADGRPTGRVDVRCPGVRCPRDRCDPGVRTDRRPVSAAAAAALSHRAGS
jgi:hypothetical protein